MNDGTEMKSEMKMRRSVKMNKTVLSRLTGMGLILISLLLLAGCQAEEVVPVEASSSQNTLSEEAAASVSVDPADRKFYNGAYAPNMDTAGEVAVPANVHPADRKFYSGWYGYAPGTGASGAAAAANIHPADQKFYNGWYATSSGVTGEVAVPANIHPADRKFFIREYATNRPR